MGKVFYDKLCVVYKSKEGDDGWRVCITEQLQSDVQTCREINGHFGIKKCLVVLKNACEFPMMEHITKKVIRSCEMYQKTKILNKQCKGLMRCVLLLEPLELVAADMFGSLPTGKVD